MQDFKPRHLRTSELADDHPILKLIRHVLMLLITGGFFAYTLITHAQNEFGFRVSFSAAALVLWMVFYSTQKMPQRRFIRAAVPVLLLGAIVITWLME